MNAVRSGALTVAGAAAAALLLGAGVAVNPQISFLLVIAVVCTTALAAPAGAWVLAALVSALTFKGLVSLGLLPTVATFLDLPLVWGALLVGLLKQRERSPFLRKHLRWLAALGFAVLLAWTFNPSEVLRPIVYLMLLGEPFAIVGALMADPPSPRMRLALQRTLLVLLLIQIPFAAIELVKFGPADPIQGTLYGAGAGAHVISAVIVVGAIWMLAGGIARRALRGWRFAFIAALVVIPFVADAKQVILVLPAIVLASSWRGGRLQLLVRGTLAVGSVVALFTIIPAGTATARFIEQSQHGGGGKQATAVFVWQKLTGDPASLVFGKGPAETVSRAAFLTTPSFQRSGFQNSASPLAVLGLKPAAIAFEAQQTAIDVSSGGTSFNTGVSSTLGVLGDLGILGALVYSGLLASLFLRLRREASPEGVAAASGFAMFIVLGLVFDWWEQPPFGVVLGVLAGLSLAKSEQAGLKSRAAARL